MPFFFRCLKLSFSWVLWAELWEHGLKSLSHAVLSLPRTTTLLLPSILGTWRLFYFVWLLRVMGGGAMKGLSFCYLASFPLIFLFTAFIHQWQFINSACFTMVAALSAKQLYDFVPLFDSYLALSPAHNCSGYFCPVYAYILCFIYSFAITLGMYLPRNVVQKYMLRKSHTFGFNSFSIWSGGVKEEGPEGKYCWFSSVQWHSCKLRKGACVCWPKERSQVFL